MATRGRAASSPAVVRQGGRGRGRGGRGGGVAPPPLRAPLSTPPPPLVTCEEGQRETEVAGSGGTSATAAIVGLSSTDLPPPPPPLSLEGEAERECEGALEAAATAVVDVSCAALPPPMDFDVGAASLPPPVTAAAATTVKQRTPGDLSLPMRKSQSSNQVVRYQEVGSQLHYHTATGNWDVVEELLDSAPGAIDCRSGDGRTILHVAASLGHLRIVEGLLGKPQVDINATMDNGITALMLAAAKGQLEVARMLLHAGASVAACSAKDGYSGLHLACMHAQPEAARLLLEHASSSQAVEGQSTAPKGGKKQQKALLLQQERRQVLDGSLSLVDLIELRSKRGYTALHLATVEADLEVVKVLLEYNADPASATSLGWTALHFAAHVGSQELADLYVTASPALVKAKNEAGNKPLHVAQARGNNYLRAVLDPKNYKSAKKAGKKEKKEKKKEEKEAKKKLTKTSASSQELAVVTPPPPVRAPPPSVLEFFEKPEYIGDDGLSLLDRLEREPELIQAIQDDPATFLRYLPPEMQDTLLLEAEANPALMQEVMQIGKDVLLDLIENHPDQLLGSLRNPLSLFKGVRSPKQLVALVRQLEENPMLVLGQEFEQNPEAFLLKQLRDNPRLLFLVVEKVKERKPHLVPLVRVLVGMSEEEHSAGPLAEKKGVAAKVRNKLWKATAAKLMKKLVAMDDAELEKLDLFGQDMSGHAEHLKQFKDFCNTEEAVGPNGERLGAVFSVEEYYETVPATADEAGAYERGTTPPPLPPGAVLLPPPVFGQEDGLAIEAPD